MYVTNAVTQIDPDSIVDSCVEIDHQYRLEVKILKELTWEYVINNPALATQQYGQRKLISDLFGIFLDAASNSDFNIFPPMFSEYMRETLHTMNGDDKKREIARTVSDYISGMAERQVIEIHQRLTGASLGSVLDPVVY